MSRRRILVADDDANIREILVMLVKQFEHGQDYEVVTAANGPDAVQAVMRDRPDLVLLDNDIPGMTGLDVLTQIHRIDRDIRVVMVTGRLSPGEAEKALKSGASPTSPSPSTIDTSTRWSRWRCRSPGRDGEEYHRGQSSK